MALRWLERGLVAALASVPLLVLLRYRRFDQLQVESLLLRHWAIWGTALALLGLGALGFFLAPIRRHPRALLLAALLAVIPVNILFFPAADPVLRRTRTFFQRAEGYGLGDLARIDVAPNHWFSYPLYSVLHDLLRGGTLITPAEPAPRTAAEFEGLLHPYYLKYTSEVRELRVEPYPADLTESQHQRLLSLPNRQLMDYHTRLRWVVVTDDGPAADTFRIMRSSETPSRLFVVRDSLLKTFEP